MPYKSSLVIGVGGTGRWVLTHLRSRLLSNAGTLPGQTPEPLTVRLLGFDLDDDALEFGGHSLDTSESYIPTSNFADVVRNIRGYPDPNERGALYKDVRDWISVRDAESYVLSMSDEGQVPGAGQTRQRGRLGVVQAMQLQRDITNIVSGLDARGEVSVFVTGSLAGGTGSATLFDLAAVVHDALSPVAGTPRQIVGVFALPAGLRRNVDSSMYPWLEANSYAAMRELDRFQRKNGVGRLSSGGRTIDLRTRLFDICYLLDGVRDQSTGAAQDIVNTDARLGIDAAMADLIWGYVHPSSGGSRASDQPNIKLALDHDTPFKFSKFGTYTVWSPLPLVQRSLVLDDAVEALSALRSQTPADEAPSIVATPKVAFIDSDGENREVFNAPVFLGARRYLNAASVPVPRSAEVLPWLLPADPKKKVRIPERPQYKNKEFPDIGRFRTPYTNPEVKGRVDKLLNAYQTQIGVLTEAARRDVLGDFRLYLLVQCQEIAGSRTAGALARARKALLEVDLAATSIREKIKELNEREAKSARLSDLRKAYEDARRKLDDDKTWNDAADQRDLFEIANYLLDAELDAQTRASAIGLLGEISAVIADIRDAELHGWEVTLETLEGEVRAASAELDRIWADHGGVVVRHLLLNRHSDFERGIRTAQAERLRGDVPQGSRSIITSPATAFVEQQLKWVVGKAPRSDQDSLLLRGPWDSSTDRKLNLARLVEALSGEYADVLNIPFGEVLRQSGIKPSALAAELKEKSGMVAASAPEALSHPAGSPREVRNLFGPWGEASESMAELRGALGREGFDAFEDTLALVAADEAASPGIPLNQYVWTDVTYHGATISAFSTTHALKQRYDHEKRNSTRPLHIFPEEEAAVDIEKRIDELVRQRKLTTDVDLLGPEAATLAANRRLVRQVVLLLAAGRLTWAFEPLDELGTWTLTQDEAEPLIVARGPGPTILLPTVVDLAAHPQEAASETFLRAARASAYEAGEIKGETRSRLEALANGKSDLPGLTGLDPDLNVVLQVASHALIG